MMIIVIACSDDLVYPVLIEIRYLLTLHLSPSTLKGYLHLGILVYDYKPVQI